MIILPSFLRRDDYETMKKAIVENDCVIFIKVAKVMDLMLSILHELDLVEKASVVTKVTSDEEIVWEIRELRTRRPRIFNINGGEKIMKITIIGAGPGDPDLITVKGLKLLQEADVVLYADSLVSESLLQKAKPEAEIIKTAGMHLEEMVIVMVDTSTSRQKGCTCTYW